MDKDQIKVAEDFKSIAERFCTLVDDSSRTDRHELLAELYLTLPELIRRAVALPPASIEDEAKEDSFIAHPSLRMASAEWLQLYESLKTIVIPNDIYWVVTDCWKNRESLQRSLADDIADIYRDLKGGICEREMQEMVREWRFSFYSHWGDHAIGALRAIHELVADVRIED